MIVNRKDHVKSREYSTDLQWQVCEFCMIGDLR